MAGDGAIYGLSLLFSFPPSLYAIDSRIVILSIINFVRTLYGTSLDSLTIPLS
jgi:hypothetical protein